MPDWEKQADFEPGGETLEGSSTTRRPDAISLDYLRAFTLGPEVVQDPSEGVFDYVWYARVDNAAGEVYVARETDAGDGWQAESLLFSFSGDDLEEIDFAFDQNGNTVLVAERGTGSGGAPELWIRFFDPTLGTQDFSSYGPGRTPRALLDAPRQPQRSDVLVFYCHDGNDRLEFRVQGDRYQTATGTGLTGVANLAVEGLAKAVDSRLQVIYSDRDASAGTYSLERLVSVLYPILAQTEAFRPTHQVLAAIVTQVVTRLQDQPLEAFRPTHRIVSAVLNNLAIQHTTQPEEAFRPAHEIIAATLNDLAIQHTTQPVEAFRPTHEILSATLEEVIIRLQNQPTEAFQPTHEVVDAELRPPLTSPATFSDNSSADRPGTSEATKIRGGGSASTNFDGQNLTVKGQNDGGFDRDSLLGFDLSDLSGETITAATLTVTRNGGDATGGDEVDVYVCARPWVESEATWDEYAAGQAWTDDNHDRTTLLGTLTVPASNGATFSLSGAALVSAVQDAADSNGFPGNRLSLILTDASHAGWAVVIDSDDDADGRRPELTVEF